MAEGELSTRITIFPSKIEAAEVSGRSENLNLGNGLNHFPENTLCQTFLVHGKGIYSYILYPLFDLLDQFFICPAFHITHGNICVGAFSCSKDLHGQLGVPDPAADESCIKYQRFYKTISGTTHDLVFSGSLTPLAG